MITHGIAGERERGRERGRERDGERVRGRVGERERETLCTAVVMVLA